MRRTISRSILAALLVAASGVCATDARADGPPDVPTSLKPTFFVVPDTPDSAAGTMLSIGTATEIRKTLRPLAGTWPWIVPEPDWKTADLVKQCAADPMALGGVVVSFYSGAASHFYLLYQSETLTFNVTAQLIACNRAPDGTHPAPTIVGVIADLPGARGTPWVVRRSQVSIPLISFAGVTALLSSSTSSKNTSDNVTTAAVLSSLIGQATSRDIPGYSLPLKLRNASQQVGVDLVRATRDLCTSHGDLGPAADAAPRDKLCTSLGFTLDPNKVDEQQKALDAYEAAERAGAHRR
jgi:hypothetical protein